MARLYRTTRVVALRLLELERGRIRGDERISVTATELAGRTRVPRQSVYTILCRFEEAGWLTSEWRESEAGVPGPPSRVFTIADTAVPGLDALLGMG
jgi:DNA-binding PadR family transcriptional regulator